MLSDHLDRLWFGGGIGLICGHSNVFLVLQLGPSYHNNWCNHWCVFFTPSDHSDRGWSGEGMVSIWGPLHVFSAPKVSPSYCAQLAQPLVVSPNCLIVLPVPTDSCPSLQGHEWRKVKKTLWHQRFACLLTVVMCWSQASLVSFFFSFPFSLSSWMAQCCASCSADANHCKLNNLTISASLVSWDNGSWLESAWVVLGLSSRRAARYCSRSLERRLAMLILWLWSLDQTTLHCSSGVWFWDKYSG